MSVHHPPPQQLQQQQQQAQRGGNRSIGNYILGRTIGEGTFGKVKLARHILSGASVAVKVLQKDRLVEVADVERVAREVHILKLLRHPHIAQLFEIIETRGQLYLIMEYASGGELFDYIVKQGRVQELEACRFFHQIIAGIERIHEMGVVHRDLKPENLLLDEHKRIKIVDFGLSNLFREGQKLSTACGSPCYAPPEMVAGQQYVPQMCDLWSCGVILFALVCGFLPFEDQNTAALYKKILAADFTFPSFPSEAVKDMIAGLLTVDPTRRLTIPGVRAHRWYRQAPEASEQPATQNETTQDIDEEVLRELEAYGFPRAYAVRCLELNKHNHMTTTYWLLLERKQKVLEQIDRAMGGSGLEGTADNAADNQPTDSEMERGGVADSSSMVQQAKVGYSPRRTSAAGPGVREGGTPRVDYSAAASARAAPVAAWNAAPSPMPAQTPDPGSRFPATGSVTTRVAASTTPRSTTPWGTATASSAAAPQRRDSKSKTASGVSGNQVIAPIRMGNHAMTTGSTPTPVDREHSATPQATPRVYETQTQKAIITPRGQTVTPRAYTPQGTRPRRQPATQPFGPPATHRTPSPMNTVLPMGMAGRPVIASPRRPIAPTATSVRVATGALSARGSQASRAMWR